MTPHFHTVWDARSDGLWVADGEHRLARIQAAKLRDVVLRPNGPPLVASLTLFWWQYTNNETPGRSAWLLDELHLDDSDPACYRLSVRSHNADRSVESRCRLTLTYDAGRAGYVYAVDTEMEVMPSKTWVVEPQGGIEFANPWFKDAVGLAVPDAGGTQRPPRWQSALYLNPQGRVARLGLNHLGGPHLWQIFFPASGGWLGFFDHPDGNPVLALEGDTAQATRAEVCAWGYDVHFIRRALADATWQPDVRQAMLPETRGVLPGGTRLSARYRLFAASAEESAAWQQAAETVALPPDVGDRLARPAYRAGLNTFQEGVFPQQPDASWFWFPSHDEGVGWDRTAGRTDSASLAIHNPQPRLAHWEVPLGRDFWMPDVQARPHRLQGWVRTDGVDGSAFLSFRYSNYDREVGQQPRLPEYRSSVLAGTQGWTHLSVDAPAPPDGATRAYIRLALEGSGRAWFDDVELQPAGNPADAA